VIEEETGTPLEIGSSVSAHSATARPGEARAESAHEPRLVARDERKNPLISTFEWTSDAAQRVLRVPAGFMRNKTQERIEELARERAASTIDLALVEAGIELGKQMMAEMIATYSGPPATGASAGGAVTKSTAPAAPAGNGSGYLNEVSPLNARSDH
jgi:hypothetical protein